MDSQKRVKPSAIVAKVIISESELSKVMQWHCDIEKDEEKFKSILFDLGVDTEKLITRQDGLQHRNRFNEVVICSRWICEERLDDTWLKSGYASKEAIDKAGGSRIIESLYREKCLTEDAQEILERRDAREFKGK
jgi:hypothetical protein